MRTIIWIYLTSFTTCLLLIHLFRPLAFRYGLIDVPEGRKQHHAPIPLIGGLAMVIAFITGIANLHGAISLPVPQGLVLGLSLLMLTGLVDDHHGLSIPFRLGVQALSVVLMMQLDGVQITHLGDLFGHGPIELNSFMAKIFTLFAVVGFTNAMNLSDGLDGLAGGLSFIGAACLCWLAMGGGLHMPDASVLGLLASVIAGFLVFNLRHPWRTHASVFMGDSGSLCLGFALSYFAVKLSQGPQPAFNPIHAVWILALPLLDTVGVFLRRLLKGQSPFRPDREHLHHALLRAGFSISDTVRLILFAACATTGFVLVAYVSHWPDYFLCYSFLIIFAVYFYGIRHAWKLQRRLKRLTLGFWRKLLIQQRSR